MQMVQRFRGEERSTARRWGYRGLGLSLALAVGLGTAGSFAAPKSPEPVGASSPRLPAWGGMGTCPASSQVGAARALATEGSTVALARVGGLTTLAYVADEDDRALYTVDVDQGAVRATTPLGGSPSSVLVMGDGRIAVALRDLNRIAVFEQGASPGEALRALCQVSVPSEPVGLATSPHDRLLLVTSAWAHELTALDGKTLATRMRATLEREPRSVVVDDDGQRAFVAHVVGAKLSVVDLPSSPSGIDTSPAVRSIDLRVKENGEERKGCQGFALAKSVVVEKEADAEKPLVNDEAPVKTTPAKPTATRSSDVPDALTAKVAPLPPPSGPRIAPPASPPIRGRIFAPMVAVDPGALGASSGGYGSPEKGPAEEPIVSVVDAGAERPLTRNAQSSRAIRAGECILPRAAAYVPGTSSLLVTCVGSDSVVELDARGLDPSGLQLRKWKVAKGPTGVAVDTRGARAVVWSQFGHELTVLPFAAGSNARTVAVARRGDRFAPPYLRGRELFHTVGDTRISADGRACASCHPDGREDALSWSTPEGMRQTIMLAGRVTSSQPFGWSGKNATLEEHLKSTFTRLRGSGFTDANDASDLKALEAFVQSMPAPLRDTPTVAEKTAAARGKELFEDATDGCSGCHLGGTTDAKAHVVSASPSTGEQPAIDTPSLLFLGGTAPYFHDGRFATLDQLLASPDHQMGGSLHLTAKDRSALTAYLETL